MSGHNLNTAIQSTLEPVSQGIRSRDVFKTSQVGAKLSSVRRSPSPTLSSANHAFQGLLSQQPSSTHVTRLSPPVGQFVINTLLQIAGFVAAIAFGIYAVQSVSVGKDANQSADIANQLALLGLCLQNSNQSGAVDSICSRVIYHAATTLPDIASTLFPSLPVSVPSQTSTSTTSSLSGTRSTTVSATSTPSPTASPAPESRNGSGALTAIIAGTVVGAVVVIGLIAFLWYRQLRSKKFAAAAPSAAPPIEENKVRPQYSMSAMQKFRRLFVETRVITE